MREAGLRRLTVSLDALDPALFRAMSGGRGEIADVLAGIDAAKAAGFESIKINCVVAARRQRRPGAAAASSISAARGHVLRFIEYMDVGTCNGWSRERVVPSAELRDRIARALAAARRWSRTIAAKSPRATRSRTGRAKSAS